MLHIRPWSRTLIPLLAFSLLATHAMAADALRVRLDWVPWGNQAPYHLAQQSSLFKKYGLDVSLDDGNGSITTVQIVGNGQYDVGQTALATMAIGRSKGLPVKAIAGFVQQNDLGLLVPKDSGIKGAADLKGRKIVFTAGSLETPFIDRFLASGHLTRGDVELLNVDASAKAGMYMMNRADAVFSSTSFLLAIVDAKRPSTSIRFADLGLQFPSFGLFATEKSIAARHDALRRFASVVSGCWAFIFDGHEDAGVNAVITARPQAKLNPNVLRQQIDTMKDYALTDAVRSLPFGTQTLSDWQKAVTVLSEAGVLDKPVDPGDLFTNDLIDPAIVAEVIASLQ
jgi:NitT/TauT family transport system substrate-binding protein